MSYQNSYDKSPRTAHVEEDMELWKLSYIAGGSENMHNHAGNQFVVFQKITNSSNSRLSYTTPGHIPERYSTVPQEHLLTYVHNSFIHNSEKLEAT